MKYLKSNYYLLLLGLFVGIVFAPFLINHKLPIPTDALVGLYHPWRDAYIDKYPQGYPYKNPLTLDPFEQQIPYRELAIDTVKRGLLPTWNPYAFAGTPLLANIQTAVFYPLNLLFFILDFPSAWSWQVFFQPLLASIFTYLYLKNLKLDARACFLGAVSFAFSGFMVAWTMWNTLAHTALWMPLILLAKDKLIDRFNWNWALILIFAESSMVLAGHIQTALYVFVFTTLYLGFSVWQKYGKSKREFWQKIWLFVTFGICIIIVTSIQWWPTLQFILRSARNFDLPNWQRPDWFLPWKHLAQLVAPDFFGNPTTGNYWGIWNYGEFVSYISLIPLMFGIAALFYRRDKKTFFFGMVGISALVLALPTAISQLPFQLNLGWLATLQPSRILILVDFSLAVLAALGLDYLLDQRLSVRQLFIFLICTGSGFIFLLGSAYLGKQFGFSVETLLHLPIAQKNLLLPTVLYVSAMIYLIVLTQTKNKFYQMLATGSIIVFACFDLFRFTTKFIAYTDASLFFPTTKTLIFLQEHLGNARVMPTDRRILPPNVSTYYHLASVEGYDPLYLNNYAGLVAAWTRNAPDTSPAAFNRIVTPQKYAVFFSDLLGVKYVLSLTDIIDPKLKLVFVEGETRVYENALVYPRAFLVEQVDTVPPKDVMTQLFSQQHNLSRIAVAAEQIPVSQQPLVASETADIILYNPQQVVVTTTTTQPRLLVLTDVFYPGWRARIDGRPAKIYQIDYAFRGVVVPSGIHQ